MQETWVQSLSQEDPLEKEMLPTLIFLPGKSHGLRSRLQAMGSQKESDTTEWLNNNNHYTIPPLQVKRYKYFIATFQKSKRKYSRLRYLWGRDYRWKKTILSTSRGALYSENTFHLNARWSVCLNSATEEAKAYTLFYVKALLLWFHIKTIAKFWGLK